MLICFDMDGVIFKDINFWMELHRQFGTIEEGKQLTSQYLHSDYERLVEEVVEKLWKGKDATPYYELVNSIKYMPGVRETFSCIKERGYHSAIISASSMDVARRVQQDHGVDRIYANELVIRDGRVSGEFRWPIGAGKERKAAIIWEVCADFGLTPQDAIYIGDSETDLEAFREVGMSIAFNCHSDELKACATYVVDSGRLSDSLYHRMI
ncbi:MAG: HAD family hydrolase [Nanobdellota archaeon]